MVSFMVVVGHFTNILVVNFWQVVHCLGCI